MLSWFGFLKLEADLAMTFIGIALAAGTSDPKKSARNNAHARKALAQIQKGLADTTHHGLSEDEAAFLEKRRAEIEVALAKL